jgi:hypothetical protein
LVVGLISASWLSFTPVNQEDKNETKNEIAEIPTVLHPLDTIKPLKKIQPIQEP